MNPARLAPYFAFAALVHVAGTALRFEALAAALPATGQLAILVAQIALLVLSGYFEGQLDHGRGMAGMPRWMQIRSVPVKLAFTFGLIYLAVVAAQTWDVKLGPVSPIAPASFALPQRTVWFVAFTVGMFFPFYLVASKLLIPVLRAITWPLRQLPGPLGAALAVVLGAGLGLGVLAAVTSARLGQLIARIQATIEADPALVVAVVLAGVFAPMLFGLVLGRRGAVTAGARPRSPG